MTDLIAIERGALSDLVAEVQELRREIQRARITPPPRWITVAECAQKHGKSAATIRRWVRQGKIESENGLVPNPDA